MQTECVITPEDERWLNVLQRAKHDFYHLPQYQVLSCEPDQTAQAYFVTDGKHSLLIPYLSRPLPSDLSNERALTDVSSAYGYPGPIWTEGAPRTFLEGALRTFAGHLADNGVVSGFFRLHTLLNEPSMFDGIGEIVNHGPSVFIDLTFSEAELWQQTRRGHKRDLVKLEKSGYRIVMDEWDRIDDFLECYYDSMRRLGAQPFYFFPKSYFEELRSMLNDRIHICHLYLDDSIACAGIVTEIDGLCQYHLSATADAHFNDHPSKLMLHHLRGWLKKRENRIFHVGGGIGALRDTLHLFKTGFSPFSADFNSWRIIPDRSLYDSLVEQKFGRSDIQNDMASSSGENFFPRYRASLPGG